MTARRALRLGLACAVLAAGGAAMAGGDAVDFNRDIRPILSENCYACHGPDKGNRKADLRLDTKGGLLEGRDDADPTVVPGDPGKSELFLRITSDDPEERMPGPNSGKTLTPEQVAKVKAWIEQGAEWKGHWAFLPPARSEPMAIEDVAASPIDRHLRAKLRAAGLKPSPEADRVTLIRRLAFDLNGLPPSKAEVDAFVADSRPDAYERLVDRLLDSPRFGERMAMYWLDLVRYADSIGYHSDNVMPVSPYRDYVIRSFNENTPFDRFTVEQLAGDMLPEATPEQKVASTYNRLLMTTEEGGAQAKEYEAKYAADRVRNVSTVWMGATLGCAQCHDHKFDPYSARDFYRFSAFFADIQEAAVGSRGPGMPVLDASKSSELKRLDDRIAEVRTRLDAPSPELAAAQADWEASLGGQVEWTALVPRSAIAEAGTTLTLGDDGTITANGANPAKESYTIEARVDRKGLTGFRLEVLPDPSLPASGPGRAGNGNFVLTEFKVSAAAEGQPAATVAFRKATADFSQADQAIATAIDGKDETGWAVMPQLGKAHAAVFEPAEPVGGDGGVTLTFTIDQRSAHAEHNLGKFRLSATTHPEPAGNAELPAKIQIGRAHV